MLRGEFALGLTKLSLCAPFNSWIPLKDNKGEIHIDIVLVSSSVDSRLRNNSQNEQPTSPNSIATQTPVNLQPDSPQTLQQLVATPIPEYQKALAMLPTVQKLLASLHPEQLKSLKVPPHFMVSRIGFYR